MRQPCVYILASGKYGTLYIGVTANLIKRIWEHRNDVITGFANKYQVHSLVWFEHHQAIESAILREKVLKTWRRDWKLNLIESVNLDWRDLYSEIL